MRRTASSNVAAGPSTEEPASVPRLLIGCGIGPTLELYDVTIFGLASALVFNQLFFPANSPATGTLLSFMTFGVGFLMRPIGGMLAGHFGDRYGRKLVLIWTLYLMGGATVLIGLLPGHAVLGLAAPVLLVVLRLLQGVAQGAETGSAALMLMEHAPPKRSGLYTSVLGMSSPLGALIATLVWTVAQTSTGDALLEWGWRIPFLLSAIVVAVGAYARFRLAESPEFQKVRKNDDIADYPLARSLRIDLPRVLCVVGVNAGFIGSYYLVITWMPGYLRNGLDTSAGVVSLGLLAANIAMVATVVLSAWLSDHLGRRPIIAAGAVAMAALIVPVFSLLQGSAVAVVSGMTIAGLALGVMLGPLIVFFAEQFATGHRLSGFSLGYQIGAAVGGGVAPSVAAALFAATSGTAAVAVFVIVSSLVTLFCLAPLRRTAESTSPETITPQLQA
ncbi:MFS transporter [Saccharopolyspora sp. ASAGF58]|uniref:MFS transporter n=1 Tax=Saccharopolyspora sp. ASAGF58 TaxID=2719023 RepID=UPI0014402F5A|nr:MFS transporter [Saccharopolyspora sp. ASAGF58]QIZ36525.1 MHS family MFS transporter [Saccharopolyspora sp. ASAGF58]